MQAIITKILPATNTRPTRIKASCERGSITVSYYHNGAEHGHIDAANALIAKFVRQDGERSPNPWTTPRVCGQLPSGDYAHVFVS